MEPSLRDVTSLEGQMVRLQAVADLTTAGLDEASELASGVLTHQSASLYEILTALGAKPGWDDHQRDVARAVRERCLRTATLFAEMLDRALTLIFAVALHPDVDTPVYFTSGTKTASLPPELLARSNELFSIIPIPNSTSTYIDISEETGVTYEELVMAMARRPRWRRGLVRQHSRFGF